MDEGIHPLFALEFILFTGAALGFGFYQLWSVRRALREDEEKERRRGAESTPPAGHAEGQHGPDHR